MLQRVNPVVTGRQLLHGNGSEKKLLNFELWKIYKETTRCLLKKSRVCPRFSCASLHALPRCGSFRCHHSLVIVRVFWDFFFS